jgi:hypothetical protein
VFFGEAEAKDIFHDTLESDPGETREPGAEFSVEKGHGVHPGFTEAGKVLVCRVNNPFEV